MRCRFRSAVAALLLAPMVLSGCYVLPDYTGHDRARVHWWHQAPADAGYVLGYAPLAPFACVEAWCLGYDRPSTSVGYGPLQSLATILGAIVGNAVGFPLYALTRPFELLFGSEEESREEPRENPVSPR